MNREWHETPTHTYIYRREGDGERMGENSLCSSWKCSTKTFRLGQGIVISSKNKTNKKSIVIVIVKQSIINFFTNFIFHIVLHTHILPRKQSHV